MSKHFEKYVDSRFTSTEELFNSKTKYLEKLFDQKVSSLDRATKLSRKTMESKFAGTNEWREQSKDRETQWVPRVEHDLVKHDVDEIKQEQAELRGKASQKSVNFLYVLSILSLASSLILFLLNRFL